MARTALSPGGRSTAARWFRRRLVGVLFIFALFVLLGVLFEARLPDGPCACEHGPGYATPPPVQTPVATPVAVAERSYENTCDGAQAYIDDLDEATTAYFERTPTWTEIWGFFLAYYRASDPPPILEEWTEAQIALWAAASDIAASPLQPSERLEAINEAEEDLEDACEGYDFTERFGG